MSDEYLWNRSGAPDGEVEELERALAPLRHKGSQPPELSAPGPVRRARWPWVAGALAAAAAATVTFVVARQPDQPVIAEETPTIPGWDLTTIAGLPLIDGMLVPSVAFLPVGRTLTTDAGTRAQLDVPSIGQVEVSGGTRLRLVATGAGAHRLALERGSIQANIWSPPGTFFVETPAGVAVDLGCAYSVTVGDNGDGRIAVQSGWVGFEQGGRESFIPAGAACAIRVGRGPGTPHFEDAPESFRQALAALDAPAGPQERARALKTVLGQSRARDALTLWHLLERVAPEERSRVLGRLRTLVPALRELDARAVLAGQRPALDDLWNRLALGPIDDWRRWKAKVDPDPR